MAPWQCDMPPFLPLQGLLPLASASLNAIAKMTIKRALMMFFMSGLKAISDYVVKFRLTSDLLINTIYIKTSLL